MAGWRAHTGQAVVLPMDNIDTDQLIPARFMSTPRAEGYGRYLLHDLRRDAEGQLRADLSLNQSDAASILIAGRNFGSGSSREAAVYALIDAGFRVVIASGFGDIFFANAINNGLLPAWVSAADLERLRDGVATGDDIYVDVETGTIIGPETIAFALPHEARTKLINGWDDIDVTRAHSAEIAQFAKNRHRTAGWAWPGAAD